MRMLPTLLCGALLALVPATEGAASPPAEVLKTLIHGRRPLADVTVRFASGRAAYRGEFRLEVSGGGRLGLEVESGGQVERFDARISDTGVRTLLQLLVDTEPWSLEHAAGSAPPDTEELSISLSTIQGDLAVEASFRITAASDSPDLLALLDVYRALAKAARGEK